MSRKSNDGAAIVLLIGAVFGFFWALIKYPLPTIIGVNILTLVYFPNIFLVVFCISITGGLIYWLSKKSKAQTIRQESNKKIEEKYGARNIDQSKSLIERNEDIIQKNLNNIRINSRSYYIENQVRDCIADIAMAEDKKQFSPSSGEYLRNWSSKANLPQEWMNLKELLLKRFDIKMNELKSEERKRTEEAAKIKTLNIEKVGQEILKRNKELIDKFLEITERKVSIIDDYGDENWEVLPNEILACLRKIAQKEGISLDIEGYLKEKRRSSFMFKQHFPDEYVWLQKELEELFKKHHQTQSTKTANGVDLRNLSGVEFEIWVSKILKENGFTDVRGTPATGDQGADLIAKKDDKTIIIQAKRYKGSVGNKAVQEVIGAVQFYSGDVGWVITNSIFTTSAKDLAYKGNVKLIDGKMLEDVAKYLN